MASSTLRRAMKDLRVGRSHLAGPGQGQPIGLLDAGQHLLGIDRRGRRRPSSRAVQAWRNRASSVCCESRSAARATSTSAAAAATPPRLRFHNGTRKARPRRCPPSPPHEGCPPDVRSNNSRLYSSPPRTMRLGEVSRCARASRASACGHARTGRQDAGIAVDHRALTTDARSASRRQLAQRADDRAIAAGPGSPPSAARANPRVLARQRRLCRRQRALAPLRPRPRAGLAIGGADVVQLLRHRHAFLQQFGQPVRVCQPLVGGQHAGIGLAATSASTRARWAEATADSATLRAPRAAPHAAPAAGRRAGSPAR